MAVELGSAYISVGLGTNKLSGDIKKAFSGAGADGDAAGKAAGSGFASGFKGIAGPAIAAVGAIGFGGLIAEAAAASDATDKFKSTMNFAGLDTSAIEAATAAAKSYADETVYDLSDIQKTMATLAANGVDDYTGITTAAGNLNAVAGGNAETFKSVSLALGQSAGAGKLMAEDWNMLADAIPGASGQLQDAMREAGAFEGNFKKAMENGEISADEFQAAISKLGSDPIAVEAARSVSTFEGALGNLSATVNSGLMGALDAMKPALTGAINGVATGLGATFDWIGNAFTGLKDLFVNGDFTGALATAFNVEEDSALVGVLFTVRSYAQDLVGGFQAMFAAFKAGDGEVTSSGFAGFMEKLGGTARQVWEAIKPLGATLGTVFAGLGPQIAGVLPLLSPFGLVFQALLPVLPQIASLVAGLAAQLGPVLGQVLAQITPILGMLVSTLSGVFVAIMPAVTAMVITLSGALAQIIPVVMGVIASILPLVATLIGQLAPIITNLVTAVLPPIVSIFGNIVTSIAPLISIIAAALIPIIMALMPVVVTVFTVVADVVKNAMTIVQGVIQVVTGIIKGDWEQVWTGIQNIFSGIWNTIGSIVSGAIQIIGSVINAGMSLVSSLVSGALSSVGKFFSDTWSNVVDGVSGLIDDVSSYFSGLLGDITGAIGDAGTALFNTGKNIVQGLIDGISSMMGAIGRAVLNIVPEAIRGPFEDLLGIHSPSRVFREYGVNIGQGLILGIDGMHGKVASSVEGLVSVPAAPSFRAGIYAPATTGGAGAASGNQFTINQVDDPIGTAHAVARRLATLGS